MWKVLWLGPLEQWLSNSFLLTVDITIALPILHCYFCDEEILNLETITADFKLTYSLGSQARLDTGMMTKLSGDVTLTIEWQTDKLARVSNSRHRLEYGLLGQSWYCINASFFKTSTMIIKLPCFNICLLIATAYDSPSEKAAVVISLTYSKQINQWK